MARFRLEFQPEARASLEVISKDRSAKKRMRAVNKCLGLLESNPRHPGLQTQEYKGLVGPHGQKVFEAYAENRTPAAFRIFFCYGPENGVITILAITPHP